MDIPEKLGATPEAPATPESSTPQGAAADVKSNETHPVQKKEGGNWFTKALHLGGGESEDEAVKNVTDEAEKLKEEAAKDAGELNRPDPNNPEGAPAAPEGDDDVVELDERGRPFEAKTPETPPVGGGLESDAQADQSGDGTPEPTVADSGDDAQPGDAAVVGGAGDAEGTGGPVAEDGTSGQPAEAQQEGDGTQPVAADSEAALGGSEPQILSAEPEESGDGIPTDGATSAEGSDQPASEAFNLPDPKVDDLKDPFATTTEPESGDSVEPVTEDSTVAPEAAHPDEGSETPPSDTESHSPFAADSGEQPEEAPVNEDASETTTDVAEAHEKEAAPEALAGAVVTETPNDTDELKDEDESTEPHADAAPGDLQIDTTAVDTDTPASHDEEEVKTEHDNDEKDEPKAEDEKEEDEQPKEDEEHDEDKHDVNDEDEHHETNNDWEKPAEGHDGAEDKKEVKGSASGLEGVDQSVFDQLGDFFAEMEETYGLKPSELKGVPVENIEVIRKEATDPVAEHVSDAAAEQFRGLGIEVTDEDKERLRKPFEEMLEKKLGENGMRVLNAMREKEKQPA